MSMQRHPTQRLAIALLALGLASCSAGDNMSDDADGALLHVFAMDPVVVPPETEFYMCQDLPNPFGKDIAILQSESNVSVG